MNQPTYLLIAALLVLFSGASTANHHDIVDDVIESVEEGFTELERRLIKRYYHERHGGDIEDDHDHKKHKGEKKSKKNLPPGLAKKESLPPGLQKQLDENGALPPGLEKRSLPSDLEDRLGKPPKGYERTIIDNDVILIEAATRKVIDIITDVVLD